MIAELPVISTFSKIGWLFPVQKIPPPYVAEFPVNVTLVKLGLELTQQASPPPRFEELLLAIVTSVRTGLESSR